jgi:hypothetical protein
LSEGEGPSGKRKTRPKRDLWVTKLILITFVLSGLFSLISEILLENIGMLWVALLIILVIILIGIVFDIIGVAVTAADIVPFVSMNSKKIRGADTAMMLIKNASKVGSFCNDVVGDVCGIISGAAGGILVYKLLEYGVQFDLLSIIISSLIAAVTVGGKALGKKFAIEQSQKIVHTVGIVISLVYREKDKTKKR